MNFKFRQCFDKYIIDSSVISLFHANIMSFKLQKYFEIKNTVLSENFPHPPNEIDLSDSISSLIDAKELSVKFGMKQHEKEIKC